ncbi:MAG: hypothetical protein OHK0011_14950 [Turneriella sp.]
MSLSDRHRITGGLIGVAVADALGVPVEFSSRGELDDAPVTGYRAFGTHNQPAGTWSDDTSLTLCLAEALIEGAEDQRIAEKFVAWYEKGLWAAHGKVFDIGITTLQAIRNLKEPGAPELAGTMEESANGNGSLMRTLPLAFYTAHMELEDRRRWACEISGFTHGHPRAKIACWFYCEIARNILNGVAAVTGGLAGCLYGIEGIPAEWRQGLVRYGDVLALAEKFAAICG